MRTLTRTQSPLQHRHLTSSLFPKTDHVCQSDVEEHSPCQGKDPVGGEAVAGQDPKAHAQVTATSRQEVKE